MATSMSYRPTIRPRYVRSPSHCYWPLYLIHKLSRFTVVHPCVRLLQTRVMKNHEDDGLTLRIKEGLQEYCIYGGVPCAGLFCLDREMVHGKYQAVI